MAVSLATSDGGPLLELDHARVARRTSILDVSNDLIRSLPARQHNWRLSTSWDKRRSESQGDDKRYFYQFTMPIHELESPDTDAAVSSYALPPSAPVARQASFVLNSDPEHTPPLPQSAGSPTNKRRNVYVCGQRMVVKQGAKPIGSIKKRSKLSLQRARLTDFAVVLAIGGLILAVIDAELLAESAYPEVGVRPISTCGLR